MGLAVTAKVSVTVTAKTDVTALATASHSITAKSLESPLPSEKRSGNEEIRKEISKREEEKSFKEIYASERQPLHGRKSTSPSIMMFEYMQSDREGRARRQNAP